MVRGPSDRRLANPIATSLLMGTSGEVGAPGLKFHNRDAESTKVVMTTSDEGKQSKPAMGAVEAVVCFVCKALLVLASVLWIECDDKHWVSLIRIWVCELTKL
jgi:hypothetical protein